MPKKLDCKSEMLRTEKHTLEVKCILAIVFVTITYIHITSDEIVSQLHNIYTKSLFNAKKLKNIIYMFITFLIDFTPQKVTCQIPNTVTKLFVLKTTTTYIKVLFLLFVHV